MELIDQFAPMPGAELNYSAADARAPACRLHIAAKGLQRWLQPSVFATVLTGFATFGLTAIQGIILARMLGPEARGEFGTAMFYAAALTYVGMLGAQYALARRAAMDPSRQLQLSNAALKLGVLTGISTLALIVTLAFLVLPAEKRYLAPLCIVAALALPAEHIRLLLLAVDQGSGAFRRYNFVNLAKAVVFPMLLLILWMTGMVSVATAVILSLAAPVVGLALRLAMVSPCPRWSATASPSSRTLIRDGRPYLFSSAVCDLYQRLDQFLFIWLGSFTVQGLYAAAVPAAGLLLVGTEALALFSFNAGSRPNEATSLRQLLHAGILLASFQMLLAAAFALAVGPLIILFYGSEFSAAVPFALALIPAHAINGFAQVVEGHLRGRGNVRVGIWARIAAAALMVAVVMLTFGRLRELSIPVAASIGHSLVAMVLVWCTLIDFRCHRAISAAYSRDVQP